MLYEQYTGFRQSIFSTVRESTDRFVERNIFRLDDSLNFIFVACTGGNFEMTKLEEERPLPVQF